MIKHFFLKIWTARAYVDHRSSMVAFGLGLLLGSCLGISSVCWLMGRPFADLPEQTALQVKSVETEKELMSRFLSGLEDLETALDDWFDKYSDQLEYPEEAASYEMAEPNAIVPHWSDQSVWFLSDKAYPKLEQSVSRLLGCRVKDPKAQFPHCRGNVYSFYDVQCNRQGCSWTLCRHNETPYSCTYSMNGSRDKFGRWENNCNIILPQSRAWCEYLRDEKGFIVNDIS